MGKDDTPLFRLNYIGTSPLPSVKSYVRGDLYGTFAGGMVARKKDCEMIGFEYLLHLILA
jgi:hypothetical protein